MAFRVFSPRFLSHISGLFRSLPNSKVESFSKEEGNEQQDKHSNKSDGLIFESKKTTACKDVLLATQFHSAIKHHFNNTTTDRSRQEMLITMTQPTEHWSSVSKGNDKGIFMPSPHTPKALRHGPRPPSHIKITETKSIAAVLFQDLTFPSRCMVPSALPKPLRKSMASNRVLFYEDELCQAVLRINFVG